MRKLRAIDLFAGCGGLTVGLRQAGFKVLQAVELDALAAETYRSNHRGVRLAHKDIRDVDPVELLAELKLEPGDLDLLTGCPPCQGFSRLRTLNGTRSVEDDRNSLLFEFARFVRALRPRAIMFENVPGLAGEPLFDQLLRKLRAAGYSCSWRIVDAADFGVPQRRKRLILLGSSCVRIQFPQALKRRKTVRQTIGKLSPPRRSRDLLHSFPELRSEQVQRRIARIARDGGSMRDLGRRALLPCHRRCEGFHDIYGRMHWDAVAPTITSGCINPSKGRYLHPEQDRCISLREAALLQSFPRTYQISLKRGKYAAAEMIGNAFPPEFARRHAQAVASALRQS